MDRIDEMIIQILREDARRSNVEIAQKVNLSEATVRRRIENLIKSGVIKNFTIEVNDSQLTSAVTWVSINPSVPTNEVSSKIRGVSGVETVYETAGQFDIAAIIKGSNLAEVNRSVEAIRRLSGVINTSTMIILRTIR